jgi:hypothetical protein
MVSQVFSELQLDEKLSSQSDETKSFKSAQLEVAEFIKNQAGLQRAGFSRLLGMVNAAQPFTMRERLHAVRDHFDFPFCSRPWAAPSQAANWWRGKWDAPL